MLNNMKYISAQPASVYYSWQVQTMIHSFVSVGVDQEDIIILFAGTDKTPVKRVMEKFPSVQYLFYEENPNQSYQPSNKPYLMWQYFKQHESSEQYFYSDCDIVLTNPLPSFDASTCYSSDTISYLGYNYIISKGNEVFDIMCRTVGIDKDVVIANDHMAGGAQYVFTGTDADFWEKVYEDSKNMYNRLNFFNNKNAHRYKKNFPIQAWTSEMWATTWNFWLAGIDTIISPDLDFAWSTDGTEKLNSVNILHNAGVSHRSSYMFRKFDWINSYPSLDLRLDPDKSSYYYYEKVKEATYVERDSRPFERR